MSIRSLLTTAAIGATILAAASAAQASNVIANGGFEAPTTANAPGSSGSYAYPGVTIDSWTYMGDAGVIDAVAGSPWFADMPPQGYQGAQYGFVQITGSVSQTFSTGDGLFQMSWLEAARPSVDGGCCNGDQTYDVVLDNQVIGSFATASGQQFLSRSLVGPTLAAGQHTLSFVGTDLNGGDNTAFIDNVSAAVPEPASWALMIIGFGGLGAGLRRTRRNVASAATA
jgi:hypothetical protein